MRKHQKGLAIAGMVLALSTVAFAALTHVDGKITSINAGSKSLTIGQTRVITTKDTQLMNCGKALTFSKLKAGDQARAIGQESNGRFVASKVCIMEGSTDCQMKGNKGTCCAGKVSGECPMHGGQPVSGEKKAECHKHEASQSKCSMGSAAEGCAPGSQQHAHRSGSATGSTRCPMHHSAGTSR